MGSLAPHLPWLRISAALVGWVVLPGGNSLPSMIQPAIVEALHSEAAGLERGYGLGVVEVAPLPEFVASAVNAAPVGCPLDLRAIVVAEDPDDTFAMVAGDEGSQLVRAGSGLRASGRLVSVAEIEEGALVLRVGEDTVRCALK
jgi:hypothetical protein